MEWYKKLYCLKDKKVTQLGKNIILGKKPEISLKVGFSGVGKNFISLMCYFWVSMMYHSCLYDYAKTAFLEKSLSQVINKNTLGQ